MTTFLFALTPAKIVMIQRRRHKKKNIAMKRNNVARMIDGNVNDKNVRRVSLTKKDSAKHVKPRMTFVFVLIPAKIVMEKS